LFSAIEQASGYTCQLVMDDAPQPPACFHFSVMLTATRGCQLRLSGPGHGADRVGPATVRALEQIFQSFRDQRAHNATLSHLYELATTLGETIHLNDLLERILKTARDLVQGSSGSLVMLDQVHSELKMLQLNGQEAPLFTTTRVDPGEDLQAWLRQEGQLKRTPAGALTPSVLGIPLRSQQRVVGSLTLIGLPARDFSDNDVQALSILAGHAANAIHNAQLYGQVERQLSELQALQQLSESLNRTISMEEVLEQLLDETLHLLEAENASVMLLEPDQETLTIKMARGLSDEVVANTRVKLGERISGRVALQRKPMLYPAFETDESGSALSVPLLKDDQILGVLNVRHKKGGGDFSEDELSLAARFANVAALSISKAGLHGELRQLFVHSIRALANAVDARDPYTSGHSERVTLFSVMIAEGMGFSAEALEELRYASLLHDIGKIRIRDAILHKPGKLTDDEYEEMKRHPEYGVEIMQPVRAFQCILPYMLYHHERYDGRGYPHGLKGDSIPLQARIMCVADCFDAMTTDRPYRQGMPVAAAVAELHKYRGSQFDPEATDLFLHLVQEGKILHIVEPRTQTA
jgi:HD-GYP domain-containing protein (c-di-GMP phosphodiesterase class II)